MWIQSPEAAKGLKNDVPPRLDNCDFPFKWKHSRINGRIHNLAFAVSAVSTTTNKGSDYISSTITIVL